MDSSENNDIIMSNKKYNIINDKLIYIEYKTTEMINRLCILLTIFKQLKIELGVLKNYLTEILIN